MAKKHILIFSGAPLCPVQGMSQVRVINQAIELAKTHRVTVMFLYSKERSRRETIEKLDSHCEKVIALKTVTQHFFYRILKKILLARLFDWLAWPADYLSQSNLFTARTVAHEVQRQPYDIIISHYWQASGFLKYLPDRMIKCIDTHYLVEENLALYQEGKYAHIDNGRLMPLLEREYQLQQRLFDLSDLLIVNSGAQGDILRDKGVEQVITIPNGQQLDYFLDYKVTIQENNPNLLFYGALSNQFNQKALKRTLEHIYPALKDKVPGLRLVVMGSAPPQWIYDVASTDQAIEVTGFVEDVRPQFARCFAAVIPLESGSGFRGRTVELMAAGVPVVGTPNALQSIGISDNQNGFVTDSDQEMVYVLARLFHEPPLRQKIADAGKEYARSNFTTEATFGRLAEYFNKIK